MKLPSIPKAVRLALNAILIACVLILNVGDSFASSNSNLGTAGTAWESASCDFSDCGLVDHHQGEHCFLHKHWTTRDGAANFTPALETVLRVLKSVDFTTGLFSAPPFRPPNT